MVIRVGMISLEKSRPETKKSLGFSLSYFRQKRKEVIKKPGLERGMNLLRRGGGLQPGQGSLLPAWPQSVSALGCPQKGKGDPVEMCFPLAPNCLQALGACLDPLKIERRWSPWQNAARAFEKAAESPQDDLADSEEPEKFLTASVKGEVPPSFQP